MLQDFGKGQRVNRKVCSNCHVTGRFVRTAMHTGLLIIHGTAKESCYRPATNRYEGTWLYVSGALVRF